MRKKGSLLDIFIFIVVAFVILVFFALWVYGFGQLRDILIDIPSTEAVNISGVARDTIGVVEPAQRTGLHILSFAMIFGMIISIVLTAFLERVHPAFFVIYIFVVIGAIITSVYLSNQYEDLMQDAVIGGTLSEFSAGSFILLHLPIFTAVIGFAGLIFLLAGILRDREQGGSPI